MTISNIVWECGTDTENWLVVFGLRHRESKKLETFFKDEIRIAIIIIVLFIISQTLNDFK